MPALLYEATQLVFIDCYLLEGLSLLVLQVLFCYSETCLFRSLCRIRNQREIYLSYFGKKVCNLRVVCTELIDSIDLIDRYIDRLID